MNNAGNRLSLAASTGPAGAGRPARAAKPVAPFDAKRQGGVPTPSTALFAADALRRQHSHDLPNPHTTPDASQIDAEFVIYRLEEAGSTLLALPSAGWTTRLRVSRLDTLADAVAGSGWDSKRMRPALPSAGRVTRMDEALGWITQIPLERHVLRRIVGARALVSPTTERHLFSWRRLGEAMGADHKAVQRWHAEGIDLLVRFLLRHPPFAPKG